MRFDRPDFCCFHDSGNAGARVEGAHEAHELRCPMLTAWITCQWSVDGSSKSDCMSDK